MSILCYHAVEDDWESPLALSPAVFEAQCAWLSRRRRVIPLRDAVKKLKGWRRLPRHTTALTFDDGFAALYDNAWQVMARHNIPSTMFIVARTLSAEGHAVDWVDTPPKHEMRCLTIEQILEMQESGVDIGSHTLFHHDLRELSDDECERDLRESREMLEDLLGRPVPVLAYPRGFNNVRVQRSAERAGYSALVVTLDNHYVTLGQGVMVAAALARTRARTDIISIGLTDVPACGANAEVLAHHRLDAASLARAVQTALVRSVRL